MAVAKMPNVRSYAQADAFLGSRRSLKIANETHMYRTDPDCIVVKHHNTEIIRYYGGPDMEPRDMVPFVVVDTDGYNSATTRGRIHQMIPHPFGVCQRDHKQYLYRFDDRDNMIQYHQLFHIREDGSFFTDTQ